MGHAGTHLSQYTMASARWTPLWTDYVTKVISNILRFEVYFEGACNICVYQY